MALLHPDCPSYRGSKHLSSFDVRPPSLTLSVGPLGSIWLKSDKHTTVYIRTPQITAHTLILLLAFPVSDCL